MIKFQKYSKLEIRYFIHFRHYRIDRRVYEFFTTSQFFFKKKIIDDIYYYYFCFFFCEKELYQKIKLTNKRNFCIRNMDVCFVYLQMSHNRHSISLS